jgi:hypothetical protein
VTLPAEETNDGLWFGFLNAADAAENLTIANDAGSTVIILYRGESAVVACTGSSWIVVIEPNADVDMLDNSSTAWVIRQGANNYVVFDTTDDAERVAVHKLLAMPSVTTVAMNDAAHALVLGTAGAGETQLVGNVVFVDPESGGASEDLTLPAEASCDGLVLYIFNTGGEGIVIKDDAAGTVATLLTAEHAIVACNGTAWKGLVGAET